MPRGLPLRNRPVPAWTFLEAGASGARPRARSPRPAAVETRPAPAFGRARGPPRWSAPRVFRSAPVRPWRARFRAGGQGCPAIAHGARPRGGGWHARPWRRRLRPSGGGNRAQAGPCPRDGGAPAGAADPPEPAGRPQRAQPGVRLHRGIQAPGHCVTGRRTGGRNRGAGRVGPWSATGPGTAAWGHGGTDGAVPADEARNTTPAVRLRALRRFRARGLRTGRPSAGRAVAAPRAQARWRGAAPTAPATLPGRRGVRASARPSPAPARPGPAARPNGSSRPTCAKGPAPSPRPCPGAETPSLRDGSTSSTAPDQLPRPAASPFRKVRQPHPKAQPAARPRGAPHRHPPRQGTQSAHRRGPPHTVPCTAFRTHGPAPLSP